MKYDPIISEQMKHLPKGCLTALTEDILRQTHPPSFNFSDQPLPTNARTSLLIIMGYGSRVRSGQSPAGDELQIKQKVEKPGCFSTGNLNFGTQFVTVCARFNVPLLIQKKGLHTKDLALAKGKKSWGGKDEENKKVQQFVCCLCPRPYCSCRYTAGDWPPAKTEALSHNPLLESNKRKHWQSRHEHKNAHRVTML